MEIENMENAAKINKQAVIILSRAGRSFSWKQFTIGFFDSWSMVVG
tara:strand:- start:317 stop:454 length:138 start_codon:yes stop_codon:yes gene_type:complete